MFRKINDTVMKNISKSIVYLLLPLVFCCAFAWANEGETTAQDTVQDSTGTVRMAFVGDIYLGHRAIRFIDSLGVDYPWGGCRDLFEWADLTVGNLEGPILDDGEEWIEKTWYLKMPPGVEHGLYNAGIRAVTMANNHIMDYGIEGLDSTLAALDSAGILHFGAGYNKDEAHREASVTIHGQRIALLGYSATFPEEFWASDTSAGTAFPTRELITSTVSRCVEEYDLVIASFHWSAERRETPKDYQVELAHLCVDLGVDLVIGHHPHVSQSIEVYRGVPIFYSLGNFAFGFYNRTRLGLAVEAEFDNGQIIRARAVGVDVNNWELDFRPVPLEGERQLEYIQYLDSLSIPFNDSLSILEENGELRLSVDR